MIANKVRQYGWSFLPRALKAGLRRLGLVYEVFYLFILDLNGIDTQAAMMKYDYSDVRELSLDDIDLFKDINSKKRNIIFERFNSKEYSCFGAILDGVLAYYTWISWSRLGYPDIFNEHVFLGDEEAFLEDSYCYPNFRGKGYHSKMNVFRLNIIKNTGLTKVLVLVLKENKPAIKVQLKSEFKLHKTIHFVSFLGQKKIMEAYK